MEHKNLWEKLTVPTDDIYTFKKDISEGKVPELPFFIVNQEKAKAVIKSKLEAIDGNRLQTNLLVAQYGNGKTNLLKYLKLYFKNSERVDVIYSRADKDRTDLGDIMLTHIQDNYFSLLHNTILDERENIDTANLANNFEDNFAEIREYVQKLFSADLEEEQIKELLYMGTGRLYTKNYFDRYGIPRLQAFNRREVLVVFLNLLAHKEKYIIFCLDEIEKIVEKSKIRFNHFLTSYREIIDLANKIKGHYILTSLTDATDGQEINNANQALYTRIKEDILVLKAIEKKEDYLELINYLDDLFETKKLDRSKEIYNNVSNHTPPLPDTRSIIRAIVQLLEVKNFEKSLQNLLKESELDELFKSTEYRLKEIEDAFKRIHQKFFDPLAYYLESVKGRDVDAHLKRQDRIFIDEDMETINLFVFNDDLEEIPGEIQKSTSYLKKHPDFNLVIFAPEKLELTNSHLKKIEIDSNDSREIEIVDYNPEKLFTLLILFKENFEKQNEIAPIIASYTDLKL